ncbi:MAG: acyl carrier protein [Chloroflexota bacterium]|nr:acyl carrier protein [Chloroflexota bacterium]
MTEQEIRDVVLRTLGRIAPEADLTAVDPRQDLREQLDLDSMDFLNFAIGLNDALGLDIPERDYSKMSTLDACVSYLDARSRLARR